MPNQVDVTVEISTKDRYYTTLPMAIMSVAHQTVSPKSMLIFDDGEQKDLRRDPIYSNLFALLHSKGIDYEVKFGPRRGQIFNHQAAVDLAQTEWIWRLDDDDAPEADALEKMMSHIAPDVGAISGLILIPNKQMPPTSIASGKIEHATYRPNIQWTRFKGVRQVDHFNNSFLFRKSAAKHGYCLELSPAGHREETLFTYGIRKAGFKLILDPEVVIWHLRSPSGGIRSYDNAFFWEHDERVYARKMAEMGSPVRPHKLFVMDCGIGDHYAFKMILPELKAKYHDHDIVLALCCPEVFEDETDVEIISIADAIFIEPDLTKHNVYHWMIANKWQGRLVDAFRKMLL